MTPAAAPREPAREEPPRYRWQRVELPGFSIDVPGDDPPERDDGFVRGAARAPGERWVTVMVAWWRDRLREDDAIGQVDAAIAALRFDRAKAVTATETFEVHGRPHVSADVLVGSQRLHATVAACGEIVIAVMTASWGSGAERAGFHRRALTSLRCETTAP